MENVVELLGLPCAGKTTYLIKSFHRSKIAYVDRLPMLRRILGSVYVLLRSPELFFQLIQTFRFVRLKYFKSHLNGLFRLYSRIYEIEYGKFDDIVLEEGLFQALWGGLLHMRYCKESKALAYKIFARLKFSSNKLIYVYTGKNNLVERNFLRPKSTRFSSLLMKGDRDSFADGRRWMAFTVRVAKSTGIHVFAFRS